MAIDLSTNNVYFNPLQVLHDVIFQRVPDINSVRASKNTPNERKYIYPTLPDTVDDKTGFPKISIIHGQLQQSEYGGARYISEDSGNTTFGTITIIPTTITIFTRKDQQLQVTDYNGHTRYVQNSAQNAWLLDRVQKELNINRKDFIDKDIDIEITNIDSTFKDNDFLWAGNINVNLISKNQWNVSNPIINTIDINSFIVTLTN